MSKKVLQTLTEKSDLSIPLSVGLIRLIMTNSGFHERRKFGSEYRFTDDIDFERFIVKLPITLKSLTKQIADYHKQKSFKKGSESRMREIQSVLGIKPTF